MQFDTYQEMRAELGRLFAAGEMDEAVELLTWALKAFPDHLQANVFNLAVVYAQTGQPEEAIEILSYGLDQGDIWFGPFEMGMAFWDQVKALDGYAVIQSRYEALRSAAQAKAKPELEIVTPEDYDPSKPYPLFMALHGGGETLVDFMPNWVFARLRSTFIVAFPQSSRVISMQGFSWMGEDSDRVELEDAYKRVRAQYAIDENRILMGGFSAGGHMTLTYLLQEKPIIPVSGFVVLCPPVPDMVTAEAAAHMVQRGQRGALLTTEMDQRKADQAVLAETLQEAGVPLRFIVTPNVGHWYPDDLPEQIDSAIDFIFE